MQKPSTHSYDYILAGAGAAGLSLLWYLLHSPALKEKTILLTDRSLQPNAEKTWCFWDDHEFPMKEWVHHSWDRLKVRAFDQEFTEKPSRFGYHCMRSLDYSQSLLQVARQDSRVTLLEAEIQGFDINNFAINNQDRRGRVITSEGTFDAEWVFQSALKPTGFHAQQVDVSLKQHFLGLEIKTNERLFEPGLATLMDFDTAQDRGLAFFYVLPFSEDEALIEYTFFTKNVLTEEQYMDGIRAYLKDRYSLTESDYEVTRKEMGVIPMEDRRYPPMFNDRVVNTGSVGGLTKPSTGYTFTRIHRHCAAIVQRLEKGEKPVVAGESSYRFRVYDMMLLYILEHQPKVAKKIFHDLFKRNPYDRVLTFLEEKTNLFQELAIFSTLPYTPFLHSIWKMKHRIFTGA